MLTQAFWPKGPLYFVGSSAVNCVTTTDGTTNPVGASCYRIRNLSSSVQYLTHGGSASVTSVGAPSQGSPSVNTIGMLPNSVETFSGLLPWMIASTSSGFEVLPGEGV